MIVRAFFVYTNPVMVMMKMPKRCLPRLLESSGCVHLRFQLSKRLSSLPYQKIDW